jgi:hypothetical protein
VLARDREALERVGEGLGDEQPVEPSFLGLSSALPHVLDPGGLEEEVEAHGSPGEARGAGYVTGVAQVGWK